LFDVMVGDGEMIDDDGDGEMIDDDGDGLR
jgi:hypothetical protein